MAKAWKVEGGKAEDEVMRAGCFASKTQAD